MASNYVPGEIPPDSYRSQQRARSEPVEYFQGGLKLRMLMPYLQELAAEGQQIAGWLDMTSDWKTITRMGGDPRDHLQTLITRWLERDQKPESPHTLSFFIGVVRDCKKGQLANTMEREIKAPVHYGQNPMPQYSGPGVPRQGYRQQYPPPYSGQHRSTSSPQFPNLPYSSPNLPYSSHSGQGFTYSGVDQPVKTTQRMELHEGMDSSIGENQPYFFTSVEESGQQMSSEYSGGRSSSGTSPYSLPGSSSKKVVQFAIMTANKNEWESARHFLGDTDVKLDEKIHSKVKSTKCANVGFSENVKYVEKVHEYRLIDVDGIQGVLVRCPDIGSFTKEGSFRTALELLGRRDANEIKWRISVIFIVGCCGGWNEQPKREAVMAPLIDFGPDTRTAPTTAVSTTPKEPVQEGTIFIAEGIIQYAIGKFEEGKINYGGKVHEVGDFWPGKVQLTYDTGKHIPKVHKATFLSGDFVIKDEDATEDLARILRGQKYVGLEMEGIGVKKAIEAYKVFCHESKLSPPKMVLVKGVSDRANMDKKKMKRVRFFSEELDDVDENSCQQMCTIMSLTLVLRAIIAHKDRFQEK